MAEHAWVVLVEDDELLQRQLAGALERALPEVAVQRTPDPDQALRLVRDGRSRLLITEAQSASVDGLALAACARRQRPTLPLIFLGGTQLNGTRARIHALGGSHMIDKPLQLERFIGLVARVLQAAAGFRGELASHDLAELVQLVMLTTPTCALHVNANQGRGTIWLDRGAVVHAVGGRERGTSAFRRMLRWSDGTFRIDAGAPTPARSIFFPTAQLLLESARIFDEEAAARAQVERAAPKLSEPLRVLAPDHFERGLQAALAKRYGDALPEWERATALEPGNRMYQHNLRRLRQLIARAASADQEQEGRG